MAKARRQFWVAVVDDDAGMRVATQALLGSAGFRTSGYRSAETFLRSARARSAGCLVLDMHMPGLTGIQLYEKLRARGPAPPGILLTADSDYGGALAAAAAAAGMLAVLHKPTASETLLQLVQKVSEQHARDA